MFSSKLMCGWIFETMDKNYCWNSSFSLSIVICELEGFLSWSLFIAFAKSLVSRIALTSFGLSSSSSSYPSNSSWYYQRLSIAWAINGLWNAGFHIFFEFAFRNKILALEYCLRKNIDWLHVFKKNVSQFEACLVEHFTDFVVKLDSLFFEPLEKYFIGLTWKIGIFIANYRKSSGLDTSIL